MSQSPYGAMWFATHEADADGRALQDQSHPLTGLCGLQRDFILWLARTGYKSQSPYGAMWFATLEGAAEPR